MTEPELGSEGRGTLLTVQVTPVLTPELRSEGRGTLLSGDTSIDTRTRQ